MVKITILICVAVLLAEAVPPGVGALNDISGASNLLLFVLGLTGVIIGRQGIAPRKDQHED